MRAFRWISWSRVLHKYSILLDINEIFAFISLWKARVYSSMHLSSLKADKTKETPLLMPQSGPYSSSGGPSSISSSGPGLSSSVPFGKSHRPVVSPMMLQRQEEDDRWLARQRALKVEKADRHGQEFQQQDKQQEAAEPQRETHRWANNQNHTLGLGVMYRLWLYRSCFLTMYKLTLSSMSLALQNMNAKTSWEWSFGRNWLE